MKILACGSRSWVDWNHVEAVLDDLHHSLNGELTVMHGGAKGADSMVAFWCRRRGVPQDIYYACWELGRHAGLMRNEFMLELRPDRVVAFWDGGSTGTQHVIREAKKRGIPTEIWR